MDCHIPAICGGLMNESMRECVDCNMLVRCDHLSVQTALLFFMGQKKMNHKMMLKVVDGL
jgi:hypothetical protein